MGRELGHIVLIFNQNTEKSGIHVAVANGVLLLINVLVQVNVLEIIVIKIVPIQMCVWQYV